MATPNGMLGLPENLGGEGAQAMLSGLVMARQFRRATKRSAAGSVFASVTGSAALALTVCLAAWQTADAATPTRSAVVSQADRRHEANFSPSWSIRPRWRLPKNRRLDCPGARDSRGAWLPAHRVRCPTDGSRDPRDGASVAAVAPWLVVGREIELSPSASRRPARARRSKPRETAQFENVLDANAVMRLAPAACRAELDQAGATYSRVPASEAPQVDQPIRVARLGGVRFVIPWTNDQQSDPHAIWDCRLAVAILPIAQWLARHNVTEVHYFSVLRRGAMARSKPRSQHNVGLALDSSAWSQASPTPTQARLRRIRPAVLGATPTASMSKITFRGGTWGNAR